MVTSDSDRPTSTLVPSLAVWGSAPPTVTPPAYQYGRDGVPHMVLEVVSHSSAQMGSDDLDHNWRAYAHMGVREYWLVDTRQFSPLIGYTLDASDATSERLTEYRRIEVDPAAGQTSRVLGTSLRWVDDTLECQHDTGAGWVPMGKIPVCQERMEAEARGRAEGGRADRLDLLLAMDVPPDIAGSLGLDMLCMDTLPGIGDLRRTGGDLILLHRYIPVNYPFRANAESRHYIHDLMKTCPSHPSSYSPGWG